MVQHVVLSLLLASFGQLSEVHQDFKASSHLNPGLKMFGADLDHATQWDGKGLRIALPKDRKAKGAVGIETQFSVSGDFEVTLDYEILSADEPKSGVGSGVKIWGKLVSEEFQAITLAHVITPKGLNRLMPIYATTKDKKRVFKGELHPAIGRKGRLRLKRTGPEVSFLFAKEGSETFEQLQRETVGTDDVKPLRISAGTGDGPSGLMVRFHDISISGSGLPIVSAPKKKSGSWVWLIVGLLVVAASGGAGGWWWYRRRKRD